MEGNSQNVFVQCGSGFRAYQGMGQDTVVALLADLGIADYSFVEKAAYESGIAALEEAAKSDDAVPSMMVGAAEGALTSDSPTLQQQIDALTARVHALEVKV